MKSVGIVRKIDSVGRIVLPIELRKTLNLNDDSEVEIIAQEDQIILRKYQAACVFCRDNQDIILYRGQNVCKRCIAEMEKNL